MQQNLTRFLAAHTAGHSQIKDHRIERFIGRFRLLVGFNCLGTMGRECHIIAQHAEDLSGDHGHRFHVIHHQNTPLARINPVIGHLQLSGNHDRLHRLGQIDLERRASPDHRINGHQPAVPLNDRIRRRKTEAVALLLGGKIGVKDALQILRRNAATLILHGYADVIPGRQRRDATAAHGFTGQTETNGPPARHRLVGVDEQIIHDLANLPWIRIDRPQVRRLVHFAFHIGATQNKLCTVLHQLIDRGRLQLWRPPLGKGQQLLS